MDNIESPVKQFKLGQDEASFDLRREYFRKLRRKNELFSLLRFSFVLIAVAILIMFAILFFKK
jgi:hypothetical protein